tara:strand:+ start:33 stop:674 length:642 start_codon:yes stop_codon:yes gene_type:complete
MAATAGYLATISMTGTATTMTNEAMSGGGVTFQITAATKRIVDPATAITIKDGASTINPSTYTFNYLTGTVVLSGAPTGSVTITGKFLPVRQIAQAYELDVSLSRTLVDTSLLGTEHTLRTAALGDITGSLSCYDTGLEAYTDISLASVLQSGVSKVIEMSWNGGTNYLRFFSKLESVEASASVDGVQTATASFSMDAQTAVTTGQEVDFSII